MSRDADLLARWQSEKPIYEAWGGYVSLTIEQAIAPLISPVETKYFLKTSVQHRLKEDRKLIEKAFYRNKGYSDPYEGITDKVGTRFVVLLGRDISTVRDALESIEWWEYSKDRDFEQERGKNPIAFTYAAVHYVVRPKKDFNVGAVRVPAGTPCEVQIKTILQHAYSELTHDTIYKPQIDATPAMQRNAAKAMALLEATNDYFEKVADDVNAALESVKDVTRRLTAVYRDLVGLEPKPSLLEGLLLEGYDGTDEHVGDRIRDLFARKPFLAEKIKGRAGDSSLFIQPSILLTYLAASDDVREATNRWPLTPDEIEPILNDFGESRF
jgi:putative GTP pyrophosphokinase